MLTFDRPESLNALTTKVADEFCAALAFAEHDDVGSVLVSGEGRAFSSGADLAILDGPKTPSGLPDFELALNRHYNAPVRSIRELAKPVVAAVNGPAAGIAVAYALACDLVVAARSSYFLLPFLNIGLVPDGGISVLLSARSGSGRFTGMALCGDRIGAEQAHQWGLVDRVEDDHAMLESALSLAHSLADGPTDAQALVKRLVNEGPLAGLDDALRREARFQGTRGASQDFAEAVAAFRSRRPPSFARGGSGAPRPAHSDIEEP
jgi:2-(1,2-epoxy-1,2-dihydrophenyl)acetyl-CoA isomerase